MKWNKKYAALFFLIVLIIVLSCSASAEKRYPQYAGQMMKHNGKLYYVNSSGIIVKNQKVVYQNQTYYFKKDGTAATGWFQYKDRSYYFNSSGQMQKGWHRKNSGKMTYLSLTDGHMVTGWQKIDGKKYYFFPENGTMAQSFWVDEKHYVNANGVYVSTQQKELTGLKKKLQSTIKKYPGVWSVYVKDLKTNEYISINNKSMYACSLIKLYALGACYDKISKGKLSEKSLYDTLKKMITVSSNEAFNTIIRKIGLKYTNSFCKAQGYTQTNQGHGTSPAANSAGLDNGTGLNLTSPKDCGLFLERVYRGTNVNKECSSKMLKFLKAQQRRTKIPAGIPSGVVVANKTGEKDNYSHDAAIVYGPETDYVIVVMSQAPGAYGSDKNISALSRIVYKYLNS
ncbi:MAG: serine hydrolase [Blautia sp.]|nr:serine hydrolase [Blautia sp.]